jgi:hypothetical protein
MKKGRNSMQAASGKKEARYESIVSKLAVRIGSLPPA